jgi:predicted methyltransferase
MDRRRFTLAGLALAAAPLVARGDAPQGPIPPSIMDGAWRSPKNKVRDPFRHPDESLAFWGLAPGMTVVEIEPSGGYWTELLAPFLAQTHGRYVAAVPGDASAFKTRFADKTIFGDIKVVPFGAEARPLAPDGTADLVLTARNFHNWLGPQGHVDKFLAQFHAALKPDGVLAVEEHRADPRPMVADAPDGYVSTSYLVDKVEAAGFRLDGKSEINANPKDTKDYPFGVWTLPPTRRTHTKDQPTPAGFDPAVYEAIGESDRMTLRFRKVSRRHRGRPA